MDFASFITSLATSFVIFLILMLLFTVLSRKRGNSVIYYPNRILKGLDPWEGGSRTRNPFSWIREALSSSEQDIISISGVDTAVYFAFLSTVLGILVTSGIVLLPVLLPVAATSEGVKQSSTTSTGTFNDIDKLSMGHIRERSSRLWAYLISTYWVSFTAYYFLWWAYNHASKLRATALMSPDVRPEQFAILVRDIPTVPQGQAMKEQVDSFFKAIYPDTFYRSMLATDNKQVNKIWKELETYKKKLAHAEAVYNESKSEGKPPMMKTGFLGLVGRRVDTIEYCKGKINELIPKLESERKVTLMDKQKDAAVVFFTNRLTAASASRNLHSRVIDTWTVTYAPQPRDVIWSNLLLRFYVRQMRQYIVYIIVALTVFFYMIPIGILSAFTTLDNLRRLLPFLKSVVNIKPIKTVLEAYLPQVVLIVFLALLPKFLLFLSKFEGIPSKSHVDRAASGKYFYFTVLNVFIGVTIGGTLFSALKSIEESPNSIVPLLAKSLPGNATFFLTYVALKFFVGYGLELSRIVPLIIYHLKKKYMCKTEEELREAWAPGDLSYATRVPNDMLIVTIVLCYSVIAPLIIPFGVAYFGLGWLVLRNQALKVYVPSYESYGRMWPHMQIRILASLLLFQITMIGYFGVKEFFYTPILIPLPIATLLYGYLSRKKFYPFFESPALEVVCHDTKEIPNMGQVFKSYLPPSLGSDKFEEEQFEDARSQVSRSASFV